MSYLQEKQNTLSGHLEQGVNVRTQTDGKLDLRVPFFSDFFLEFMFETELIKSKPNVTFSSTP